MIDEFESNKAFTLIELIVVIAVIGILVLLAAPRFLGYTEDAKLAQIKNDAKAYENAIEAQLVQAELASVDKMKEWDWSTVESTEIQKYVNEGSLFDKSGAVEEFDEDEFFKIDDNDISIKSKLKGDFIYAKGGKVFYQESVGPGSNNEKPSAKKFTVTFEDLDGKELKTIEISEGESAEEHAPKINKHIPGEHEDLEFHGWNENLTEIFRDLTTKPIYKSVYEWNESNDAGITQFKDGERGYFRYVGTGQEIVEIPRVIQGAPVTSYHRMFFSSGEDIKKVINTDNDIADMSYMFSRSKANSLDLSSFDTKGTKDMGFMFSYADAKTLNLNGWDTSEVKNMRSIFSSTKVDTLDLSALNTASVNDMHSFLRETSAVSIDLRGLNTAAVEDMQGAFSGVKAEIIGLKDLNVSSVKNMAGTFSAFKGKTIDISGWDTKEVQDMTGMFSDGMKRVVGSSVSVGATGENNLTEIIGLDKLKTSNVTTMNSIFFGSKVPNASIFDLNYDLSSLTDMTNLFQYEEASPENIAKIAPFTKKATDMTGMFYNNSRTDLLDLSSFNTSNTTSMRNMFEGSEAKQIDFSSFNTSKVNDMSHMFYRSKVQELDLSKFKVEHMPNVDGMFFLAQATVGYAGTIEAANLFNSSSKMPDTLKFEKK